MGIRLVEGVTVQGERFDGVLDSLRREGLLEPDEGDDRVRATARGMEVLDAVIAALDTGLSG